MEQYQKCENSKKCMLEVEGSYGRKCYRKRRGSEISEDCHDYGNRIPEDAT